MTRQVIAFILALPLLATCLFRTEAQRNRITLLDREAFQVATYIGDASFALTGALAAGIEGMDLVGCIFVGFTTALGGGTVRDIALGRFPIFWTVAWDEALLSVLVAMAAFFLWPRLSHLLHLSTSDEWLFWTDTLGLGVFAALGAQAAAVVEPRVHIGACVASGLFTATFGGLTRDLLCQKPPRILYSAREMYAVPALGGAAACSSVMRWGGPTLVLEAILLGTWVTIELRVLAVNHGLRLPTFPREAVYKAAQPNMTPSWTRRISLDPEVRLLGTDGAAFCASPAGHVGSPLAV